ncbi:TadE/TadG family type IV pilus assembly protein [Vibrio olivae]|uniref:TadE/TadG family type IV pilus assembly protein n=1 Tax=Vibrio olivae TaxID=1243002 RepID=A0ABV5HMG5_9VIBR
MKRLTNQRGIAAVEFLTVLPLLLFILLAVAEFGQAFITFNVLNKQAQNGIRYATSAIQGTASYDQIANETNIKNMVVYGKVTPNFDDESSVKNLTTNNVTVDHSNGYVTISINYNYIPIIDFIPTSLDLEFPLNTSVVMRTLP